MRSKGFTIIEILVVIAVISIVGVIITEIFFNTLKGSNKSNLITKIKQNGQSALEIMDKTIRNADHVVCPVVEANKMSASDNVLVVEKDGKYIRFSLQGPKDSNSFLVQDNPAEFDNSTCITPLNVKDFNITDKTQIKVISPDQGKVFSRNKSPGFKDVVSISFQIAPGVEVSSSISSQIDPIPFATSIGLR